MWEFPGGGGGGGVVVTRAVISLRPVIATEEEEEDGKLKRYEDECFVFFLSPEQVLEPHSGVKREVLRGNNKKW